MPKEEKSEQKQTKRSIKGILKKVGIIIGLLIWGWFTIALASENANIVANYNKAKEFYQPYTVQEKIGDTEILAKYDNTSYAIYYKTAFQVTQEHKLRCFSFGDPDVPPEVSLFFQGFRQYGYNAICIVPIYSLSNQRQVTYDATSSMQPTINRGCYVIAEDPDRQHIGIGDIIQYATGEQIIEHRIIGIRYDVYLTDGKPDVCYITKGDNNFEPDENCVPFINVRGKVVAIVC